MIEEPEYTPPGFRIVNNIFEKKTGKELKQLEKHAKAGCLETKLDLYSYYKFFKKNEKKAKHWLEYGQKK